ncbi:predicted protein, partial [Paecilomyces variotii No. 5]
MIMTKQEIEVNLQAVDVVCQKTEDTTRELSSSDKLDTETRERLAEIQRDVRILQLAASDIHRRINEIVERAPPGSFDPPKPEDNKRTPPTTHSTRTGTAEQTPDSISDAQFNQARNLPVIDPLQIEFPPYFDDKWILDDLSQFEEWHSRVEKALKSRKLADLINEEIPRPSQDDIQAYQRWRAASLRVTSWLMDQLGLAILEKATIFPATFAGEFMVAFRTKALGSKININARIWHTVMNMKRSQFDSMEQYVKEWQRRILQFEQQDLLLGATLQLIEN